MTEFQIKYKKKIEELVEACHHVANLGYTSSAGGNLSLRADDNVILITPTKTPKRTMRFEDICAVDLHGKVLYAAEGKKPTGETPFHIRIMNKRPDVKAIVHTHPPYMTGFALTKSDMLSRPYLPEMVLEVGPILVVPYATPLSEKLSLNFDAVIDKSNGFLMENHGVLFCSDDSVFDAVEKTQMAENMAQSIFVAKCLGGVEELSEKAIAELEEVSKIRNLNFPGRKGVVNSLIEQYQK